MQTAIYAALSAIIFAICGCSSGNSGTTILESSGKHPSGWAVANTGGKHPSAFLAVPSSCYECHGKDLTGGISKVSCFSTTFNGLSCHAGGPSGHPAGWADPDSHGKGAKALATGINGFPHCQVCHGTDFSGGIAKKTCLNTAGCHGANISAPHSPSPWRDVGSTGARSHASTDTSNAAACAVCHLNGNNSNRKPSPAAPAGTPPDCFNNTLCHGVEGHATGWKAPNVHGPAAKAASGGTGVNNPTSSFASCAECHGKNYDGGVAEQSCLNNAGCHGANVASPHPAKPWRSTTGGLTHTSTDTDNAAQCALCHTAGANSDRKPQPGAPVGTTGCFNNTLCHGTEGHVPGWSAPAQHGASAKLAPSPNSGFSYCQSCHGSTFNNGTPPACTNGLGCHGLFVSAPHPVKPWTSTVAGAVTHTTTDTNNAATCAICHTGGANSSLKPPTPATGNAGCFNNTLCHFHQLPYAPPVVAATVHGGEAKKDLRICQSCHGTPGTPSFDGGTASRACSGCHTFAKAHPTDWQGSSTFSHRTAGNLNTACTLCHDVSLGRTPPLPSSASCFSTTFTNGLGQTRTCHASGPGKAAHIVPYNNHNATARANSTYCLGCHQLAQNTPVPAGDPPGCMNCHLTNPQTNPNNCISCHQKPPGGTVYPNNAVSHAAHNSLNVPQNSTQTAQCDQCHQGLGLGTIDHLNRARNRSSSLQPNAVVFGTLAKTGGLSPVFNQPAGSCSSAYCHGITIDIGGQPSNLNFIATPTWTVPFPTGTVDQRCGSCHGYPPQTIGRDLATLQPHTPEISCNQCHPEVNSTNDGFTPSGAALHIDGKVDASVASHSVPFFTHAAAAGSTCMKSSGGCHNTGTGTTLYPLVKDSSTGAPDCMSCHTLADPLLAGNGPGNCRSCHGTGGTGTLAAPTGISWPNIRGSNTNARHPSHEGSVCGSCHPGVDSTGRTTTNAAGYGSGINHGPNKNKLSGTIQTNNTQTVTGITPNATRGTGSTCSHSSIPTNSCHSGPGTQTWTAP